MLPQHYLKASYVRLNTYSSRREQTVSSLQPSCKRPVAPWMSLGAGKNSDSAYIFKCKRPTYMLPQHHLKAASVRLKTYSSRREASTSFEGVLRAFENVIEPT